MHDVEKRRKNLGGFYICKQKGVRHRLQRPVNAGVEKKKEKRLVTIEAESSVRIGRLHMTWPCQASANGLGLIVEFGFSVPWSSLALSKEAIIAAKMQLEGTSTNEGPVASLNNSENITSPEIVQPYQPS